jgi:hypothetical protein
MYMAAPSAFAAFVQDVSPWISSTKNNTARPEHECCAQMRLECRYALAAMYERVSHCISDRLRWANLSLSHLLTTREITYDTICIEEKFDQNYAGLSATAAGYSSVKG